MHGLFIALIVASLIAAIEGSDKGPLYKRRADWLDMFILFGLLIGTFGFGFTA